MRVTEAGEWDRELHRLCKVALAALAAQGLFPALCYSVLILPGLCTSGNNFILETAPCSYSWELWPRSSPRGFLWLLHSHSAEQWPDEVDPGGESVEAGLQSCSGAPVPRALSLAAPEFCYRSRCSYNPSPRASHRDGAGESHPNDMGGFGCTVEALSTACLLLGVGKDYLFALLCYQGKKTRLYA